MSLARKTILLAAAMTMVLVYIIAERAMVLASDTTVLLRTAPVDPTSLFRGDYVILSYDISSLDPTKLDGPDLDYDTGDTVYVALKQDGEFWAATGIYDKAPQTGTIIKGTVDWARNGDNGAPAQVRLNYGIESYFVPEGKGRVIEDAIRNRPQPVPDAGIPPDQPPIPPEPSPDGQTARVAIEVALTNSGKAAIKTLFLDGEPYYRETIF